MRAPFFARFLTAAALFCAASAALPNEDCAMRILHGLFVNPPPQRAASPAPPAQLGDQKTLHTHIPEGRVPVTLVRLGERAAYWVETQYAHIPGAGRLQAVANEFDQVIYPRVRSWFGSEATPGIDGDPRAQFLLHDVEANGSAAGFGGYVSPANADPRRPDSNVSEMIAIDVFAVRDYGWMRLAALIAHEFNHLTNWNQRGGRVDERWLEEGRATFAEWAVYNRYHTNYFGNYLANPTRSLTAGDSFETIYGASYLLLLYLHDNFGGRPFTETFARTPERGFEAIERALEASGETRRFEEIFHLWAFANLVNDADAHPLASYRSLDRVRRIERTKIDRRASYPFSGSVFLREWSPAYVQCADIPAGPFAARVRGSLSARFGAYAWRPATGEFAPLQRNAEGEAVYAVQNAAPGEDIYLIVSAPVDQRLFYSAQLEENADPLSPPRPAPVSAESGDAPFVRGWLPAPPTLSPALEPIGSLPLSGEAQSLALNGNNLWVGYERGIARYRLDDPDAPAFAQMIPSDGPAHDLTADEQLLIAALGQAGAALYNPENGERIGWAHNGGTAHRVARQGDWLWALNEDIGARLYDISNPAAPRRVRTLRAAAGLDLHIQDGRLYLCDRLNGMTVYNIENAPDMELVGTAPLAFRGPVPIGDRIWGGSGALVGLNAGDPNAIEVEATMLTTAFVLDAVLTGENRIALAEREAGVRLVDLSNPLQPRSLSRVQTRGLASRAAAGGDRLYIADMNGGVSVIDIADPMYPMRAAQIDSSGTAAKASAHRGMIFASAGRRGVLIADANPSRDGVFAAFRTRGNAAAARAFGGMLYAATSAGLEAADIADPAQPRALRAHLIDDPLSDLALSSDGARIYAAGADLYIYAALPDGPQPLQRVPIDGQACAVALSGGYAVVGALNGGVSIVEIDPEPRVAFRIEDAAPALSVAVSQGKLFVGAGEEIAVYDLTNPPQPRLLNRWDAGFCVQALAARGSRVFAGGETRAAAWDARDPLRPEPIANERGFEWVGGVALTQDRLIVSDRDRLHLYRRADDGALHADDPRSSGEAEQTYGAQPLKTAVGANFPNPFNPETWIPFTLASPGRVQVAIYDAKGRVVRRLSTGTLPAGRYETRGRAVHWDGRNERGETAAGGVYYYEMSAPGYRAVRKMAARP